jgi:hypothetical protein
MVLEVKNNPVLFPKLSFEIIASNYELKIKGRKRADFKLAEYLLLAADGEEIPDVAVFNLETQKWEEHFCNQVEITSNYAGTVRYKRDEFKPELLYAYINFIALQSSASFDIN